MEINKIQQLKLFLWLCFAASICFTSAKKTGDSISDYQRPVVESFLVPGKPYKLKFITRSIWKILFNMDTYNRIKAQVSMALVRFNWLKVPRVFYVYADSTFIKDKKSYSLSFQYNNKAITAQTTVPDKPTGFQAIKYTTGYSGL